MRSSLHFCSHPHQGSIILLLLLWRMGNGRGIRLSLLQFIHLSVLVLLFNVEINHRGEMNQQWRKRFDSLQRGPNRGDNETNECKLSSNWDHFNLNYSEKKYFFHFLNSLKIPQNHLKAFRTRKSLKFLFNSLLSVK